MQVLLDESGDLGWTFNKPYNNGGSSRYLTLAFMFLPKRYLRKPKEIIRKMYRKYKWRNEKKANTASIKQKETFCYACGKLLEKIPEIKIDTITVFKENVEDHIRQDANKLYNFMAALIVPEYIISKTVVDFIPDERTIKVKSGNSLVDHLKTKIWFERGGKTKILNKPGRSHEQYNLQFIDWISHCVWKKFEHKDSYFFDILIPFINHRKLFFN